MEQVLLNVTDKNQNTISESLGKAKAFLSVMIKRRSTRHFSKKPIDIETIKTCIEAAGTSPSGANRQPWFFALVTSDHVKMQIREQAEQEEKLFYTHRANDEMLAALKPLGTTWCKPHLEDAPALIVIFSQSYSRSDFGKQVNYYPKESTGIATGFLISALEHAGLNTLTHTPSPMGFLNKILERPNNERPFLILAVGYAHEEYEPVRVEKKNLNEIFKMF